MICNKCGTDNQEKAMYCAKCGASMEKSQKEKKCKPTKPLIIGLAAVLAVLAVIIAVVIVSVNSSPYSQIMKALDAGRFDDALVIYDENRTKIDEKQKVNIEEKLMDISQSIVDDYIASTEDAETAIETLESFYKWDFLELRKAIQNHKTNITALAASRKAFENAESLFEQEKYMAAIAQYQQVISTDENYQTAIKHMGEAEDNYRQGVLCEAEKYGTQEDYVTAIDVLQKGLENLPNDHDFNELLKQYNSKYEEQERSKIEYLFTTDFHDGRAWMKYTRGSSPYLASLDKEGSEVFCFDATNISSFDDFDEGYAYLHTIDNDIMIVDKTGTVCYTISQEGTNKVLSYGGGYALCTHHEDSFTSSYDVYEVYSPAGIATQINIGGSYRSANYCGSGVFGIELREGWYGTIVFYNASSNQWILTSKKGVSGAINVHLEDGKACVGANYFDPDETGYRSTLKFITEEAYYEVPLYIGWSWNDYGNGYHDGSVVLNEIFDDAFYCYDVASGTSTKLEDIYAARLEEGDFPENCGLFSKEFGFQNDRIVLFMRGDDNLAYIGLFDKQWNAVLEPMEYDSFIGFDGSRLMIKKNGDTVVYDRDGQKLFTAAELGLKNIFAFSDGVAMIETGKYIDQDGNILFDNISLLS